MRGLRIDDGTNNDPTVALPPGDAGCLNFDLAEILTAVGDAAIDSEWLVTAVDCFGDSYAEFIATAEGARVISGARLLDLASRISQIIDGEFVARSTAQEPPWLVIKAIDSSWWEVWTDDERVRASIRRRFNAVSDIAAEAS